MLLYLRVGSRITITQAHTQTMQQTHTHKAVARYVKVKMLLPRRRQLDYRTSRSSSISDQHKSAIADHVTLTNHITVCEELKILHQESDKHALD